MSPPPAIGSRGAFVVLGPDYQSILKCADTTFANLAFLIYEGKTTCRHITSLKTFAHCGKAGRPAIARGASERIFSAALPRHESLQLLCLRISLWVVPPEKEPLAQPLPEAGVAVCPRGNLYALTGKV